MKEEKIKKKKFSKQNTNFNGDDKNLIETKIKRGRNNNNELDGRQNNSMAYHHDMNLSKNKVISNKNNIKQLKSNKNKKLTNYNTQNLNKNVVQNLMTDFDQTMQEYSSLYGKHNATTTKGVKSYNDKGKSIPESKSKIKSSKNKIKSDSKSRLNGSVDQIEFKKNKTSNRNQVNALKNDDYRTQSIDSRKMKTKNDNQESGNSLKRNKSLYDEVNPDELSIFRGAVDYNYAFAKNIDGKINELKNKYKRKGFTFNRKSNHEFVFIKGPYKHHVELMKLENGLFYFNIKK